RPVAKVLGTGTDIAEGFDTHGSSCSAIDLCWIEIDGGERNCQPLHSPLMLPALMTSLHLLVSAAMKAAKSAGEPTLALALSFDRVSSISFDVVIALIAALSLLITSGGVPAGATTAVQ